MRASVIMTSSDQRKFVEGCRIMGIEIVQNYPDAVSIRVVDISESLHTLDLFLSTPEFFGFLGSNGVGKRR